LLVLTSTQRTVNEPLTSHLSALLVLRTWYQRSKKDYLIQTLRLGGVQVQ
jgi:hypothetical protein